MRKFMAKYCVKCGYKMEDDDLVCGECGTPAAIPQTAPEKAAKINLDNIKTKISKPMLLGVAAIAVLIVVLLILVSRPTTVKLDQYVSITFDGYEGYGTATADFDYDAFYADYSEKIEYAEENEMAEFIGAAEALEAFCIYGSLDVTSGLSNGDLVTYSWDCDDNTAETEFNVKLEYSDISVEASGLEQIKTVDLFDGVYIVCSGTDGYGNVSVATKETAEWKDIVSYSIDSKSRISNGDTVTVVADCYAAGRDLNEYFAKTYGMLPEAYEKEFEVSGLKDIVEFDPFEYVEVSFSGTAPNGEVSITVDKSIACMEHLSATANSQSGLKNGDEVTVTLDLDVWFYDGTTASYLAENYGKKAASLTMKITLNGTSVVWQPSDYADVEFLEEQATDSPFRKVEGGYLCDLSPLSEDTYGKGLSVVDTAGNYTVEVWEAVADGYVVAESFDLEILLLQEEYDKWFASVIESETDDSMNPKEKMDAISAFMNNGQYRYYNEQGGYYLTLASSPNSPDLLTKRLNSYTSPNRLAKFANLIGGFDEIHNCYFDYPYGTSDWYEWHYQIYVVYEGETYYYSACPSMHTGTVYEIQMIDFTNTEQFTLLS